MYVQSYTPMINTRFKVRDIYQQYLDTIKYTVYISGALT